jgi:collagen triple helix repeat protein
MSVSDFLTDGQQSIDIFNLNVRGTATGVQGIQGPQGASGPQGAQGSSGSGATGPQGPQGASGSTGPSGAQGLQGHIGANGPQGAQGSAGTQGPQGSQGSGGVVGVVPVTQGGTGVQGYTTGSIPYYTGTVLGQDNAHLAWDEGTDTLDLGGTLSLTGTLSVNGTATIDGSDPSLTITGPAANLFITAANPNRPALILTAGSLNPAIIYQFPTTGVLEITNQNTNSNVDVSTSGTGILTFQGYPVLYSTRGQVTQTGVASSPVTYNGTSCNITTVTLTNPPAFTVQFVWNNSFITATSIILISVSNDSSPVNGFPLVYTDGPNSGSTTIVIQNVSTSTSFAGTLTLSCLIC